MAGKIQCDYDRMAKIAQTFAKEAQQTLQCFSQLNRIAGDLQNGGWVGEGNDRFQREFEDIIRKSMNKLVNVLQDAGQASQKIAQALRGAEEEAGALFGGGGGGVNGKPGGGGGAGTNAGNGSTGGGGGAGKPGGGEKPAQTFTYPKPTWPVDLKNSSQLDAIIKPNIRGQNTKELADVMKTLNGNPKGAELDAALTKLAEIRGVPDDKIKADYNKFVEVRNQAEATRARKGLEPISQLADGKGTFDFAKKGESFWGTTDQLRHGKILGDTFGIDPAFGSLLNPTGGLAGPGDTPIYLVGENSMAVNVHGAVHDAGGYLKNYHDVGPGYHYVPGTWQILDTTNPLAGQVDGIKFWVKELDKRGM